MGLIRIETNDRRRGWMLICLGVCLCALGAVVLVSLLVTDLPRGEDLSSKIIGGALLALLGVALLGAGGGVIALGWRERFSGAAEQWALLRRAWRAKRRTWRIGSMNGLGGPDITRDERALAWSVVVSRGPLGVRARLLVGLTLLGVSRGVRRVIEIGLPLWVALMVVAAALLVLSPDLIVSRGDKEGGPYVVAAGLATAIVVLELGPRLGRRLCRGALRDAEASLEAGASRDT